MPILGPDEARLRCRFLLGLPSFMVTDDGKVVSSYVSHVWRWWAQGNPFDVVAYLHLGIMAFGAL